jgi:hypothetical protein
MFFFSRYLERRVVGLGWPIVFSIYCCLVRDGLGFTWLISCGRYLERRVVRLGWPMVFSIYCCLVLEGLGFAQLISCGRYHFWQFSGSCMHNSTSDSRTNIGNNMIIDKCLEIKTRTVTLIRTAGLA